VAAPFFSQQQIGRELKDGSCTEQVTGILRQVGVRGVECFACFACFECWEGLEGFEGLSV